MRTLAKAILLAAAAAAIAAAPASGHAFYVDATAGPGHSCQTGDPCATIAEAMAIPDPDPMSPDIVVVSPGTYTENVVLDPTVNVPGADRSLLAAGAGQHVIQPANPLSPTVEIGGPANVVGFSIAGPQAVVINGSGRVSLNTFDSATVPNGGAHVSIGAGAVSPVVEHNTFADDGAGTQIGIRSLSTGSPAIRQNSLTGFWRAIEVGAGSPALDSNLAVDGQTAIDASASTLPVHNLTAYGNSVADLALHDTDLTLDSSIVEHPIDADPQSACIAIVRSAGPTLGGGPCEGFQLLSTAPGFVDPGNGDYHLSSGSPLIDAGDPLLLSGLDLDGGSRVVDGNCDGQAVRDIGADELDVDCPPPPVGTPPPVPPELPAGDTDPPDTSISSKRVDGTSVRFRFRADEPGVAFLCRLDRRQYRDCESPVRYQRLDRGRHVFRVKAVDVAGNEDPEPARGRFRIGGG